MPHMGLGPKKFVRYVSNLFEKSVHVKVPYLSKFVYKLCFQNWEGAISPSETGTDIKCRFDNYF